MSNPNIALSFCYTQQREVSFSDTDMGGIVHFPNYLKYVEDAEYQFLHSIGLSAILEDERGKYGFPRIRIALSSSRSVRRCISNRFSLFYNKREKSRLSISNIERVDLSCNRLH